VTSWDALLENAQEQVAFIWLSIARKRFELAVWNLNLAAAVFVTCPEYMPGCMYILN